MQREKGMENRGGLNRKKMLGNIFIVILAFYPLRHINWGIDLWDTGYNYANFTYMGTEHMDPMWLFSTYLATAVGKLLTKLPNADSLTGMNFYTGLLISAAALLGYLFCTRKLKIPSWAAFLGELAALSLCWCPSAVLYNYITYVLLLGCVILLYLGLTEERPKCLIAAGVCLGANVLVRFSNLPQAAMILAVWAYDLIVAVQERRPAGRKREADRGAQTSNGGFWKRTRRHTGWCLLGYLSALLVLFLWIQIRYGLDEYIGGIQRLFAMTDNATDYKAVSMVRKMIGEYVENLYWVLRILVIVVVGTAGASLGRMLEVKLSGSDSGVRSVLARGAALVTGLACVALGAAMLCWLYGSGRFCSLDFYDYGSMHRPGVLLLMLAMGIAAVRIFHPDCPGEEKLVSGMTILVILLTSIGSNNGVMPSINNLFIAAPYTIWESWRFLCHAKEKRIGPFILSALSAKCILTAFLLMCAFQFGGFGASFVFAESHGVRDTSAVVENNRVLRNVKMSPEKAGWMRELSAFVNEKELQGQEVILYGYIPALSYYLQMPSAFNPWSDLRSYSPEAMRAEMEMLEEETPVIILEDRHARYLEGMMGGTEAADLSQEEIKNMDADGKWRLIVDFVNERGYIQTFRNGKFAVYQCGRKESY